MRVDTEKKRRFHLTRLYKNVFHFVPKWRESSSRSGGADLKISGIEHFLFEYLLSLITQALIKHRCWKKILALVNALKGWWYPHPQHSP